MVDVNEKSDGVKDKEIGKYSKEFFAMETILYCYPWATELQFNKCETPDFISDDQSIGIEVVRVDSNAVFRMNSDYHNYCHPIPGKDINELEKRIEGNGGVIDKYDEINLRYLQYSLPTNEEILYLLKERINAKNKKCYKATKVLYLALLFSDPIGRDNESCLVDTLESLLVDMDTIFDGYFIITERLCFKFFKVEKELHQREISIIERDNLRLIGRKKAENL